MTKVDSGLFQIDWVHPICVIWNPFVKYKNFTNKNAIMGDLLEFNKHSNQDRSCAYCDHESHRGFKLECDIIDCDKCFHVTCAVKNSLIFECDKYKELYQHKENSEYIVVFCKDHLELGQNVMSSSDSQNRRIILKMMKKKSPFKLLSARLKVFKDPVSPRPILRRPMS